MRETILDYPYNIIHDTKLSMHRQKLIKWFQKYIEALDQD